MGAALRKILLGVVFGCLLFPVAQQHFQWFSVTRLRGAYYPAFDATFGFKNWFSGHYQKQKEKYLNENFGCRNLAVRLHNQIDFSLFSKVNAKQFVIGKEGCIYAYGYLDAYSGRDFVGVDSIARRMQRLKFVQDTLQKLNKSLLFVFAPGKASFYPEYFPDAYSNAAVENNNYHLHLKEAQKQGLHFIDFNSYFIAHKKSAKYPLHPKNYGIHWSEYGMCLAMDSLVKYIEKNRKTDLPNFYWSTTTKALARGQDLDIVAPLNLLYFSNSEMLGYPDLKLQSGKGKSKLRVMGVGDSFYLRLTEKGFGKAFGRHHFWYYNNTLKELKMERNLTLEEEISNCDVLVLMVTEANLKDAGWGFVDQAYGLFARGEKPYYDVMKQ